MFQVIEGDAGGPVLVSWDLTLWRTLGSAKADADRKHASPQSTLELFEEIVLPHLDAAHNLARWLTRNEVDAQDVVQESYLRAFRFFDGYKGGDSKAWLLAIVRNTCRTWQRRHSLETGAVPFEEAAYNNEGYAPSQEESTVQEERIQVLRSCIEMLPVDFREVLIMRELEEMSYREIADATGLALGTVMSRLSRARKRLEQCAANRTIVAVG
jgi:RNA polymerase sigma-70 factor (ECF subfamily)